MVYKKLAFFVGLVIMTALVLMAPRLSQALRGAVPSVSRKSSITNPVQGLQVTNVSFSNYDKAIKAQLGPNAPTVNQRLRDYVLTLKNTSNQPILAYHLAFVSPSNPKRRESLISFPVFTKEDFASGTEITKEIKAIPADYELQVRAVVYQGFASEGDTTATRQLVVRLQGAREKIMQIRGRVEEVSKLSDALVQGGAQNLAAELAAERASLEQAYKKYDATTPEKADELDRALGEMDALGVAQLHVARLTGTSARPKAETVLQSINDQLTKLQ